MSILVGARGMYPLEETGRIGDWQVVSYVYLPSTEYNYLNQEMYK